MRTSRITVAAVAALAVVAAGCSVIYPDRKKGPPCPGGVIVRDLSHMTVFRPGAGRDITDIVFEARLPHITVACKYDDQGVEVQTALTLIGARGPANTTRTANLSYFVAILDPKNKIIAKKVFASDLRFPPNVDRGSTTDELVERIPVGKGVSAAEYVVVTGFQLDQNQLAYNRANPDTRLLGPAPPRNEAPLVDTGGIDQRSLHNQSDNAPRSGGPPE
jgi:hypothetical protein